MALVQSSPAVSLHSAMSMLLPVEALRPQFASDGEYARLPLSVTNVMLFTFAVTFPLACENDCVVLYEPCSQPLGMSRNTNEGEAPFWLLEYMRCILPGNAETNTWGDRVKSLNWEKA